MLGESAGWQSSLRDLSGRRNPLKYNELFGVFQRIAGLRFIEVVAQEK